MSQLSLTIEDFNHKALARSTGVGLVNLVYDQAYQPGDQIRLTAQPKTFLIIQLDDAMNPSFVYMREAEYSFPILFGDAKLSYNPKAFTGEIHLLRARVATAAEIAVCKNIAQNVYDCHENAACFPHASANVETRGESVFAARNAIDGNTENHSHGNWPYESWGINRDPEAEITIDFGRDVRIKQIVLFTRADFPHDNWWKQADLSFSDGSVQTVLLQKTDQPQIISVQKERVSWVKMGRLLKDENDPSPFPALTQIQIIGNEWEQ